MLTPFSYAAALAMTVLAVWRLPGLPRGVAHRRSPREEAPHSRSDLQRIAMWGCCAGFAVTLWAATPVPGTALDRVTPALSVLVKDLSATLAISALLVYVSATYGRIEPGTTVMRRVTVSRRIAAATPRVAAGVLIATTVLFFTVVDRRPVGGDFVTGHLGQGGATLYQTVNHLAVIVACAVCGYQWTYGYRRADTAPLRIGLLLMSAAMCTGALYTAARLTLLWTALATPVDPAFARQFLTVASWLQDAAFLAFAVGASTPAAASVLRRRRRWDPGGFTRRTG